ncbi:hypothetical protein Sjap_002424 [Stephania japonica]|uniref:Cytochrome P450 n=1 Tax=Stephania japonica TaxID=461633 RepID=A0AAP0PUI7_9MAGN
MATITDEILLCFICLICFFLIQSLLKRKAKYRSDFKHPPSPPALPFIGHLHHLSPVIHQSFHRLAQRYGPLMHLRIGASNMIVVSSAASSRDILKIHESLFSSRLTFGMEDYNIYEGHSFATAEYGPYWRFMKRLCMSQLMSASQLDRFIDVRREEMKKLLESLAKSSKENVAVDLGAELTRMMNNVLSRMVMSTRSSDSYNEAEVCRNLVLKCIEFAGKLSMGDILGTFLKKFDLFGHGRKLVKSMERFDKFVESIMERHERMKGDVGDTKDMMDILLEVHHDQNSATKLTRKGIKNFVLEMYIAGVETSSKALQWAAAELICNPIVFDKLREEIVSLVGTTRLVQESDVPNLPYLQAVVKEALRLHAPAPLILRKCTEDCKINGLDILKDTRILVNAYSVMRDPLQWKEPNKFMPERFLVGSEENIGQHPMDMKGLHLHYIPFGSGRRGCPGASLALNVMHRTLATLVQCFDFQVGKQGIDMKAGSGFTTAMKKPLICYPILRFSPI